MGQLIALDAGNGVKGILAIDYDRGSDSIHGRLTVPRRGAKPYKAHITVNLGEIRKQAQALLSNRTGWSLKGAWRAVKKATNRAALEKVLRTTTNIMKDPRFKGAVLLASTVYPPIGITYGAIQQGADIIQKAKAGDQQAAATLMAANTMAQAQSGDPAASAQWENFLALAQAGNPIAAGAAQNLKQLTQGGQVPPETLLKGLRAIAMAHTQGANPSAAISGWFYHRVYRSPLEAKELDSGNPKHVLRALYHRGTVLEKSLPKRSLFSFFN